MIYADNAATTKLSGTALNAMLPYLREAYGNPSSLYSLGQQAAEALAEARQTVADCLHCRPEEIYFTSGGSEADNQAILSAARRGKARGKTHIISTSFEHHAVLHTLQKLERESMSMFSRPTSISRWPAACTASVWKRTFLSRHSRPMSAMG